MSTEGPTNRRQLLRSFGAMTFMTLLSRITGLMREQVRGHYLATGLGSDAFGLAGTIPNLLRSLCAEGAMTAAFVPVFTEYLKKGSRVELWDFARRFLTLLTLVVTGLTVIGILAAPWLIETFFGEGFGQVPGKVALTIVLTQIMFPYLMLISVAAVLQGILNSFKVFSPSAFSPVLLNLSISLAAVVIGETSSSEEVRAYALSIGFVLGGVLQMVFQLPYVFRQGGARLRPTWHFNHPGVRRVLRIMLPGMVSAGIYQVNVFVAQLIASRLYPGSITALQFSVRLQELVLGLFAISVTTVVLPTLSEYVIEGNRQALRSTLSFSLRLLALLCLPATAGLIVLGRPIIQLLFQHGVFDANSTEMTRMAQVFHASAVYLVGAGRVVTQVFFAMKDQKTPMMLAAVSMLFNIGGCLLLPGLFAPAMAHGGVAAAGTLAAFVSVVMLVIMLRRRIGRLDLRAVTLALLRIGAAALIMGLVLWGLDHGWHWGVSAGRLALAARLIVQIVVGLSIYVGVLLVLRSPELKEIRTVLRRRRPATEKMDTLL